MPAPTLKVPMTGRDRRSSSESKPTRIRSAPRNKPRDSVLIKEQNILEANEELSTDADEGTINQTSEDEPSIGSKDCAVM